MKHSKQRDLIASAVVENDIHPTAGDVYSILKPKHPGLSLGTVYRNLNQLSSMGVIRKLSMPDGQDRFDGRLYPHYHVSCTVCNKVFDISLSIEDTLYSEIYCKTGVEVCPNEIYIKGICSSCKNSDINLRNNNS